VPDDSEQQGPAPDDLITSEVAATILGVSTRQVQRMVERKQLTPFAYVNGPQRRMLTFRRSYIEAKKKLLDQLHAAEKALRED
jgi:hypothetical protein